MGTDQPKGKVFGDSKLVFGFLAVSMLSNGYGQFVAASARSSGDTYPISAAVGGAIGAMLLPLGIGWIAYFISRRGRAAARITACLLAGLMTFAGLGAAVNARSIERAKRAQANTAEMNAAKQEQADAVRSGDIDKITAASQRMMATTSKLTADSSASVKAVMATAQRRGSELLSLTQQTGEHFKRIGAAGGTDPATMKTKADVESRLAMVDAAEQHAEKNRKHLVDLPDLIRADLISARVPESQITEFFKGFSRQARVRESQIKLAESNLKLCGCMRVMVTTLNDNWGKWSINPNDTLEFGVGVSESSIKKYNEAAEQLNTLMEAEDGIVNELADRIAAMKTATPPGQ